MNDNGSVMRGPEVAAFAQKHKLVQVSIADLIAYRQSRDKLVERVGAFPLASEIGTLQGYAYVTPFDRVHHMAFVYGDIGDGKGVLARLHRADVIGDVFGGAKSIRASLKRFKAEGRGVIVYLRDGTAGVPVAEIPHGSDTETDAARSRQWREIGLGAQILKDLGISSIRLLDLDQAHLRGPWRLRDRDCFHGNVGKLTLRSFFCRCRVQAFQAWGDGHTTSQSPQSLRPQVLRLRRRRRPCRGLPTCAASAIPVDVELVIAVDVSYSMDPDEQALQREGYVLALTSKEFLQALRQGPTGKSPSLISNGPASPTRRSSCRGG